MISGEPIAVPPKLRSDDLEHYRLPVQAEMDRLNAAAERWAETNRFDLPAGVADPRPRGWRLDPAVKRTTVPIPGPRVARPWRQLLPTNPRSPRRWWAWFGTRSAALVAAWALCLGFAASAARPRPDRVRHPARRPRPTSSGPTATPATPRSTSAASG